MSVDDVQSYSQMAASILIAYVAILSILVFQNHTMWCIAYFLFHISNQVESLKTITIQKHLTKMDTFTRFMCTTLETHRCISWMLTRSTNDPNYVYTKPQLLKDAFLFLLSVTVILCRYFKGLALADVYYSCFSS